MARTISLSLVILIAGSAFGLLGVGLFADVAIGLNVSLFTLTAVAAVALIRRYTPGGGKLVGSRELVLLGLTTLGFAWRDSTTLNSLAALSSLLVFAWMRAKARGLSLPELGPLEGCYEIARSTKELATELPALVRHDIEWRDLKNGPSTQWRAAGRGLLAALPLVLVFGVLLNESDRRFAALTTRLLDWNWSISPSHVVCFIVCSFITVALLRNCLTKPRLSVPCASAKNWNAGSLEVGIVLGAVNVLFASYILVQSSYFFGSDALVREHANLDYAQYARSGFFELVYVSTLVAPLLVMCAWLTRDAGPLGARCFRALAGALVMLVIVIVASAFHRMSLYVNAYGLTELRFYSSVFMLWLSAIYLWCARTVVLHRPRGFFAGSVYAAISVVVLLFAVNPDGVIARTNMERSRVTGSFDEAYVLSLSADAGRAILHFSRADPSFDTARLAASLIKDTNWNTPRDWRAWNLSRALLRAELGGMSKPGA